MKNFILIFCLLLYTCASAQNSNPVIHSTLIFPLQEKHVHGSTLVHLPNGDKLVAWFEGSGERKADDVKIKGSRLKKGEMAWSKPFELADTPNIPDCNPVLFLNSENVLFLVWIAIQANLWEQSILRVKTSKNYLENGPPVWNWQDVILLKPNEAFATEVEKRFKDLPENNAGWAGYAPKYDDLIVESSKNLAKRSFGWMTRIKPLLLANQKIVLPLYSDGFNMSLMAISNDDGLTWHPSLPLVGRGPIQPAIIKKKNGNLVAFLRDSGDEPARVQKSESLDEGESWTAAEKTEIPNTASVELLVLKDGRWGFVGNDSNDGRHRLSLFLSDDEGASWKWKTYLENTQPTKGSFSYPSLTQSPDGYLHVTYSYHLDISHKTIKYVVLDPSYIPQAK